MSSTVLSPGVGRSKIPALQNRSLWWSPGAVRGRRSEPCCGAHSRAFDQDVDVFLGLGWLFREDFPEETSKLNFEFHFRHLNQPNQRKGRKVVQAERGLEACGAWHVLGTAVPHGGVEWGRRGQLGKALVSCPVSSSGLPCKRSLVLWAGSL